MPDYPRSAVRSTASLDSEISKAGVLCVTSIIRVREARALGVKITHCSMVRPSQRLLLVGTILLAGLMLTEFQPTQQAWIASD